MSVVVETPAMTLKLQFILPYVTLNNVPVQCDEGCELCMYTGAALSHAAQYPHRLRERDRHPMSYKQRLVPRVHTSSPLRHLAGALLLIISAQVYIWEGLNKYNPQSMAVMAVTISLKC